MKKYINIFLFLALLISNAIFATTQTQSVAAAKLSGLLNQFTTFQAQFKQQTTDLENKVLQTSEGKMMLVRPGRFRWETNQPSRQIVITDGKTLWVYDVDLKQATKQTIQHGAINPAKVLSGDTHDLLEQFDVHMVPHHNVSVFQMIPKKHNQQFRSISMVFKNDKLIEMRIENNLEQITTFQFYDVLLNTSLSPELFEFKAPAGVDVLR